MKREILFRGKSNKDGKWLEGMLTKDQKGHFRIQYDPSRFSVIVTPETVGQFTGLFANKRKADLDKRIFEGDIFRHTKETDEGDIVGYSVIMWIDRLAAFYLIPIEHYEVMRDNDVSNEKEFIWLFGDAQLRDFSIDVGLTKIGNVHDNPELLK